AAREPVAADGLAAADGGGEVAATVVDHLGGDGVGQRHQGRFAAELLERLEGQVHQHLGAVAGVVQGGQVVVGGVLHDAVGEDVACALGGGDGAELAVVHLGGHAAGFLEVAVVAGEAVAVPVE